MTSYHTIRKDFENAGAKWVDKEVVTDKDWGRAVIPTIFQLLMKSLLKNLSKDNTGGK